MITLTTEQAQQIEEALDELRYANNTDIAKTKYYKALSTIRAARAQEPITTPDVCGEVCARAKLCYGCGKALDEANAKLSEQADHIAGADNMVCNWYQDDGDGIWATDCGGVFEIIEGSPSDNDMKFCPYCGKPLEEHPFVDSEEQK